MAHLVSVNSPFELCSCIHIRECITSRRCFYRRTDPSFTEFIVTRGTLLIALSQTSVFFNGVLWYIDPDCLSEDTVSVDL